MTISKRSGTPATGLQIRAALNAVLVDGMSVRAAAEAVGISKTAVHRYVLKNRPKVDPADARPLPQARRCDAKPVHRMRGDGGKGRDRAATISKRSGTHANGRQIRAALNAVLVDGMSVRAAAAAVGISKTAVNRYVMQNRPDVDPADVRLQHPKARCSLRCRPVKGIRSVSHEMTARISFEMIEKLGWCYGDRIQVRFLPRTGAVALVRSSRGRRLTMLHGQRWKDVVGKRGPARVTQQILNGWISSVPTNHWEARIVDNCDTGERCLLFERSGEIKA